MKRTVASGALLLVMLVLLSGCFGDKGGAPEDPEIVAQQAIKSFGASAGSQDGGDIKRISGNFEMAESAEGNDMGMGFGDASADMTFEWGTGDVVHIVFAVASGGMTFTIEAWCSPTQQVIKWGNDVYTSRPGAGAASQDEMCSDFEGMESPSEGFNMFEEEAFEGITMQSLETNGDGTITAVYYDAENETTMTATIDTKGRVSRIAMDSPDGTGAFDITYGKRDTISIPAATKRLAADVEWHTEVGEGAQVLTITSSPHLPPLDEIEARLILRDWENDTTTTAVAFPTSTAGPQTKDGYTFEYMDHDEDGRVSENDTWRFSHPDWADSWWIEEDPDLFDLWAGTSVNESFTPGPGLALILAVGALALVVVGRRRWT